MLFTPFSSTQMPSYGIDIDKFHPNLEKRPDPMKSERDILYVARLSFSKGIDVLLQGA